MTSQCFIRIFLRFGVAGLRGASGSAVLCYFWCDVAVIFISKYCIAVFRVQAVCGEFKFYIAVIGEKNRCVAVICFFFMTRGYKS